MYIGFCFIFLPHDSTVLFVTSGDGVGMFSLIQFCFIVLLQSNTNIFVYNIVCSG